MFDIMKALVRGDLVIESADKKKNYNLTGKISPELEKQIRSIVLIKRYEVDGELIVSTIKNEGDSDLPYETAIYHPSYHSDWIVVKEYKTKAQAVSGHNNWIESMTSDNPPEKLTDVSTSNGELVKKFGLGKQGNFYRKIEKGGKV